MSELPANSGHGLLYVLSAPSGAGKTTLCRALRRYFPALAYSVSYTTRTPRTGEADGQDYYFISVREFKQGIANGRWAEWAQVHGQYYGTSAAWISGTLATGVDILMDIDVQGARQIVQRFANAVTIFILPPSMEILSQRLKSRRSDDDATIALRLKNARHELAQKDFYQYQVVNDDLEAAVRQLAAIFEKHGAAPQKMTS
jgi:guanylate kinase